MRLPTRTFRRLWHVGTMKGRPKRSSHLSYEGHGLSVSQHPEDWAAIAKLGSQTWLIQRKDGHATKLVDMLKLSRAQREQLAGDLLNEAERWKLTYTDQEDGEERWSIFSLRAAALAEAQDASMDGADPRVEPVTMLVAAPELKAIWKRHFSAALPDEIAEDYATLVALEEGGYDGAWWNDRYDPQNLSAPRGVIFQSAVTRFVAALEH